jgi:5'-nucleotidase
VIADNRAGTEQPGQVTFSELFSVQPFNNVMTVKTLTGGMIKRLLEQQFVGVEHHVLQVSSGFTYRYDLTARPGERVASDSITLGGRVIAPNDRVRVAMNSFLAAGGDGFTVFREGTDQLGGDMDVDALVAYFRTRSPVGPGAQNRIVRLD